MQKVASGLKILRSAMLCCSPQCTIIIPFAAEDFWCLHAGGRALCVNLSLGNTEFHTVPMHSRPLLSSCPIRPERGAETLLEVIYNQEADRNLRPH